MMNVHYFRATTPVLNNLIGRLMEDALKVWEKTWSLFSVCNNKQFYRLSKLLFQECSEDLIIRPLSAYLERGTSRQRSGKGAIRKVFPLQKPRWEKTNQQSGTHIMKTYRKPNEHLFSQ